MKIACALRVEDNTPNRDHVRDSQKVSAMSKRFWAPVTALACCSVVLPWAGASQPAAKTAKADKGQPAQAKDEKKSGDFFCLAKVHSFHIEIAAKEWDTMQPKGGGFPFGGGRPGGPGGFPGGPGRPEEQPKDKPTDVHKGSGFGIEFPW